jgi:hypothetical protein
MHNRNYNSQKSQAEYRKPLFEGLEYKDLEGILKPTIHVDEFSSKMGEDSDIIVISFFVRDKKAAKDLVNWFEKGYDFILDADMSPGEIKPNRYLVYIEMRRRTSAPTQVAELIDDMSTLTEFNPDDWIMVYEGNQHEWNTETFAKLIPLSPNQYRKSKEADLNEWRVAAGMETKQLFERDSVMQSLQNAAGI